MSLGAKTKILLLFLGDVIALYAGLFVMLLLRYGAGLWEQFTDTHVVPFSIIFVPWILVFYIAGLYDLRSLRNNLDFLKTLALSLIANAIIAIILFYAIPVFGIAPKTNLFIFIIIFAIIEVYWRRLFNRMTESGEAPNRVIFIGNGATATEAETTIQENAQLGYAIAARLTEEAAARTPHALAELAEMHHANLIVVPRELKRRSALTPELYKLFGRGVTVLDLDTFYETVMRKVPLADVGEAWFLENIENAAKFYDPFKRALELLCAIVIGVVLLPFEGLIAFLVKLTSRGPTFIRQKRVGTMGEEFTLYKFRSMVALSADGQAETQGAQWTMQNDARVTPF